MWWKSNQTIVKMVVHVIRCALTLEEKGPGGARALGGIGLVDRGTVGGGVGSTVLARDNLLGRHDCRWK